MRIILPLLLWVSISGCSSEFDEMKALAEQGDAKAQNNLGLMYANGNGTPQDYKEAVKWFRAAAEQGLLVSQITLALTYDLSAIPQDQKEAYKWFKAAAEQGSVEAQFELGLIYAKGVGVLQDYKWAHMWYNLAAANGSELGRTNRDEIAKQMTPADISEAQQMASDWVKDHP
ncbi:sel1 repeat family protein [Pseudomonadales bacterium]|nr:sel1 repeat family protein [Pseudomonadales bacterium]